jgi:hypothetical protein
VTETTRELENLAGNIAVANQDTVEAVRGLRIVSGRLRIHTRRKHLPGDDWRATLANSATVPVVLPRLHALVDARMMPKLKNGPTVF